MPNYTPHQLLIDVEDKIRVSKHADEWDAAVAPDTPAMALNATQLSNQMKEFLTKQISFKMAKLLDHHKNKTASDGKQKGKFW
jgi:hypothetical protein